MKQEANPPVAGVGRARRYCNTGTTRGCDKASFESSLSVQTYDRNKSPAMLGVPGIKLKERRQSRDSANALPS